jgi:hypothetical protein
MDSDSDEEKYYASEDTEDKQVPRPPSDELIASHPIPKLEDHPLLVILTAYSIYSQISSIMEVVLPSIT